jgi:hypothetical protein
MRWADGSVPREAKAWRGIQLCVAFARGTEPATDSFKTGAKLHARVYTAGSAVGEAPSATFVNEEHAAETGVSGGCFVRGITQTKGWLAGTLLRL